MSSTICLLCERVKLVVQPNFGFTMLRLSTETSTPRFDVLPRFVKRLV